MTRLSKILGQHQNLDKIKLADEMFRQVRKRVYDPVAGNLNTTDISFAALNQKWFFKIIESDYIELYLDTDDAQIEIASYNNYYDLEESRVRFSEEQAELLFQLSEYLMEKA